MHTLNDDIKKQLALINSFTADDLERPTWGEINFRAAEPIVTEVHGLTHALANLPTEHLAERTARSLLNALNNVASVLTSIRGYSIQDRPQQRRDDLIGQLASQREELILASETVIPFLSLFRDGLATFVADFSRNFHSASDLLAEKIQEAEQKGAALDELLDATRIRTSKDAVAEFAKTFDKERSEREAEAKTWLRWSAGFAIATVAVPLIFLFLVPLPTQGAALVQYVSTKVVVLAIFVAATTWCAGNYRAARHLATVNGHKANSLTSFMTFVRSTDDRVTRDQVLLETTRSIFAQPPTGFLKGETHADQPSRMVEVFKATSGS